MSVVVASNVSTAGSSPATPLRPIGTEALAASNASPTNASKSRGSFDPMANRSNSDGNVVKSPPPRAIHDLMVDVSRSNLHMHNPSSSNLPGTVRSETDPIGSHSSAQSPKSRRGIMPTLTDHDLVSPTPFSHTRIPYSVHEIHHNTNDSQLHSSIIELIKQDNDTELRRLLAPTAYEGIVFGHGRTPLMLAALYNAIRCTIFILESTYPTINAQNEFGATALMYAVAGSSLGCLQLLLDKGAAVTLRDRDHLSPFGMAARIAAADAIKLLMPYWPKPTYSGWSKARSAAKRRALASSREDVPPFMFALDRATSFKRSMLLDERAWRTIVAEAILRRNVPKQVTSDAVIPSGVPDDGYHVLHALIDGRPRATLRCLWIYSPWNLQQMALAAKNAVIQSESPVMLSLLIHETLMHLAKREDAERQVADFTSHANDFTRVACELLANLPSDYIASLVIEQPSSSAFSTPVPCGGLHYETESCIAIALRSENQLFTSQSRVARIVQNWWQNRWTNQFDRSGKWIGNASMKATPNFTYSVPTNLRFPHKTLSLPELFYTLPEQAFSVPKVRYIIKCFSYLCFLAIMSLVVYLHIEVSDSIKTPEIVLWVFVLGSVFQELRHILQFGRTSYDLTNLLDMYISACIATAAIIRIVRSNGLEPFGGNASEGIYIWCMASTIILVWWRALMTVRHFEEIAGLVTVLNAIDAAVRVVRPFVGIVLVFTFGFFFAYHFIIADDEIDGFLRPWDSLLTIYFAMFVGGVSPTLFTDFPNTRSFTAQLLSIFHLSLMFIVLLNMLIAAVWNTYDQTVATATLKYRFERARAIWKYDSILSRVHAPFPLNVLNFAIYILYAIVRFVLLRLRSLFECICCAKMSPPPLRNLAAPPGVHEPTDNDTAINSGSARRPSFVKIKDMVRVVTHPTPSLRDLHCSRCLVSVAKVRDLMKSSVSHVVSTASPSSAGHGSKSMRKAIDVVVDSVLQDVRNSKQRHTIANWVREALEHREQLCPSCLRFIPTEPISPATYAKARIAYFTFRLLVWLPFAVAAFPAHFLHLVARKMGSVLAGRHCCSKKKKKTRRIPPPLTIPNSSTDADLVETNKPKEEMKRQSSGLRQPSTLSAESDGGFDQPPQGWERLMNSLKLKEDLGAQGDGWGTVAKRLKEQKRRHFDVVAHERFRASQDDNPDEDEEDLQLEHEEEQAEYITAAAEAISAPTESVLLRELPPGRWADVLHHQTSDTLLQAVTDDKEPPSSQLSPRSPSTGHLKLNGIKFRAESTPVEPPDSSPPTGEVSERLPPRPHTDLSTVFQEVPRQLLNPLVSPVLPINRDSEMKDQVRKYVRIKPSLLPPSSVLTVVPTSHEEIARLFSESHRKVAQPSIPDFYKS